MCSRILERETQDRGERGRERKRETHTEAHRHIHQETEYPFPFKMGIERSPLYLMFYLMFPKYFGTCDRCLLDH